MTPAAPPAGRLVRPSLATRFHIDYDWWERESRELRVYLQSHLCPEHRTSLAESARGELVDWVDPVTAEVQRVDGIQHALRTHCALQADYLTEHTTLTDAIFRVFLANGNEPLTPTELAEKIHRPGAANTILRTLSGHTIYHGLRPVPG